MRRVPCLTIVPPGQPETNYWPGDESLEKDGLKQIVCAALDEARNSGGIMIFAYVIMPDHTHLITDNAREIKDVLRFMNGISAKRIIDHLKSNGFESSLAKLRIQERENGKTFRLRTSPECPSNNR